MGLRILTIFLVAENIFALKVTCNTKFSSLNHSISKVICPPNCPLLASSTLCGSSVYSEGQICLAAMQDQRIDDGGGVVDVYRGSRQNLYSAGFRNGVQSISCSSLNPSYSFKMSCSTNGNSEYPVTQVDCPPGCRGKTYSCGTGIYSANSTVCAAAAQQGLIGEKFGGSVTFYKYTAGVNIAISSATSCQGSWFTFEDMDECAISNPCPPFSACVDILPGWSCGKDCSLGVRYSRKIIPDVAMSASSWSVYGAHQPRFGRLNQPYISRVSLGAWIPRFQQQGEWIQVALLSPQTITGVITQGRGGITDQQWATSYKIAYLPSKTGSWKYVSYANGSDVVFVGNADGTTPVTRRFPQPVNATKLRLYPQTYHNRMALRHEYLIC